MSPINGTHRFAMVVLVSAVLSACNESPLEPAVQEHPWSANYQTATKFGGVAGTWRAYPDLEVTADGRVLVGATEIVNPQLGETTLTWSLADGNSTNASVQFLVQSGAEYFWGDVTVAGRLFQGWIQNPGEGRLDYRGLAR